MNNSTAKAKPKMTVKNGVVYGDALSAQEKKRIVMQKKKDRKAKKVRKSAQQTIPYVEMCRDGICKVNSRLYTKSIAFEDINYQLAQNEDKTAIFENWCDFLNYFDSSIFVQLSFINQKSSSMSSASASTFRHRRTPSTTSAPSIPVCCKASSPRVTTDWSRRSTSPSALRQTPSARQNRSSNALKPTFSTTSKPSV